MIKIGWYVMPITIRMCILYEYALVHGATDCCTRSCCMASDTVGETAIPALPACAFDY
jgi:hypothetical protein